MACRQMLFLIQEVYDLWLFTYFTSYKSFMIIFIDEKIVLLCSI